MQNWLERFASYKHGVTQGAVENWLNQFSDEHTDLGARILDAVQFISSQQISASFKDALATIAGWSEEESEREGNWRFVAFSGSSGESGDAMQYRLRSTLGLGRNVFNPMFPMRSDLARIQSDSDANIVFIDDFAGTGSQATKAWNGVFSELVAGRQSYLLLAAATQGAIDRIHNETNLHVVTQNVLHPRDNVTREECTHFNPDEKAAIRSYGERADPSRPVGYGDCGLLLVFQHNSPNNSLPILHATRPGWRGIFPRDG